MREDDNALLWITDITCNCMSFDYIAACDAIALLKLHVKLKVFKPVVADFSIDIRYLEVSFVTFNTRFLTIPSSGKKIIKKSNFALSSNSIEVNNQTICCDKNWYSRNRKSLNILQKCKSNENIKHCNAREIRSRKLKVHYSRTQRMTFSHRVPCVASFKWLSRKPINKIECTSSVGVINGCLSKRGDMLVNHY